MKKFYIFLVVILCFLLFWVGSLLYSHYLTTTHGDEFIDLSTVGFDCMHPWEGEPELRVLTYSSDKAEVYYFKETGGEKAVFVKHNGNWEYEWTSAMWSDYGGTADDYLIWPYFRNFVP